MEINRHQIIKQSDLKSIIHVYRKEGANNNIDICDTITMIM